MTAQQPMNNIVRVTIEALAAILGGAQSLSCNSMDEAVSLPSQEAAHLSLMTQHILAHETGVADVVDPLAGSYYIESLTSKLEDEALALMDEISQKGGAQKAIEDGFYQRLSREAANEYQQAIEAGRRVIVGLNRFREEDEKVKIQPFRVDDNVQASVIEKLERIKSERDPRTVKRCLEQLARDARQGKNCVPALIDCAQAYATIAEMCTVLSDIWGTYQEQAIWI
jgi:methylmalonyl-CoA mutase N-terminal domain/subunit